MGIPNRHTDDDIRFEAYLNLARHFFDDADRLLNCPDRETPRNDTIYYLFSHAAELALKSFLMFENEKPSALKKRRRHNLRCSTKMYSRKVSACRRSYKSTCSM